jgi:hypothetical protein
MDGLKLNAPNYLSLKRIDVATPNTKYQTAHSRWKECIDSISTQHNTIQQKPQNTSSRKTKT